MSNKELQNEIQQMSIKINMQGKVGKKAGNTHISQDGGKYW